MVVWHTITTGDVASLKDSTGKVLNSYETIYNPFSYSGGNWNKSTSLQYLRARWYDPSMGRFISEDTYEGELKNPLSLNLYTYVENNPLKYHDPSGHAAETVLDLAFLTYDGYQLIKDPSLKNGAYFAWSLGATVLPFVPGSYVGKGLGKLDLQFFAKSSNIQSMLESPLSKKWGVLEEGTNQGVKHFSDYWDKYPERIPSLAKRLGVDESKFANTVKGFENFTIQAQRVLDDGIMREINGKKIYYLDGAQNDKKGIVVIVKDGKIKSMMPSDPKSFGKLK
jgi:RHS repeat-associated protein